MDRSNHHDLVGYNSIPGDDAKINFETTEELPSCIEVEELDLEVEKAWPFPRMFTKCKQNRAQTCMSQWRRYRWLLDTVLLVINISLSIMLLRGFERGASFRMVQVGGDFAGAGPTLPIKIVKFSADVAFVPNNTAEFFEDETIAVWNTMMPVGTGWGVVSDETFFTTSMTHQLHCVFMMARIYSAHVNPSMMDRLPVDYHSHYLHCVDYLRQAIKCSADLAMEPHDQRDADDNGPLDGSWNGHHGPYDPSTAIGYGADCGLVCKDSSHVIPYLEEQIFEGIRTVLPIDD